ncbi:MAG: lactate utilization protein [Negativicutes bacterium]|nr:lactate utilization protein [Negativicutes bacterium]
MNSLLKHHYELTGKKVVEALNKNRFKAEYADTKAEAVEAILKLINAQDTIGMGGSVTLDELSMGKLLNELGNKIFNHQGLPPAEAYAVRRQQLTADVFLASSNAVTMDGEIINTDGTGNRVAAMTFGPKRVIVVMGANKIVKDEFDGRRRIAMTAAPMNADRLNRKTPCVLTGVCSNCNSPERICSITTILHKAPSTSDFHVIIVGEALGY